MTAAVKAELAAKQAAINSAAALKKGTYWAAGTGYGHGGDYEDGQYDDDGNIIPRVDGSVRAEAAKLAEAKLMKLVRTFVAFVLAHTLPCICSVAFMQTDEFLQVLVVAVEPRAGVSTLPASAFPVLATSCLVAVLRCLVRQSLYLAEHFPSMLKTMLRTIRVLGVQVRVLASLTN